MTLRIVSVKEVLRDIRSGMDEAAIKQKHSLSTKGLENLYKRLIEAGHLKPDLQRVRRRLNIAAILEDITAGMSRPDLMKKHALSEEALRKVSKRLLEARGVRSADDPTTLIEETLDVLATVEFVRHEVDFDLPIYDANRPEIHGTVRDVSEEGIGVEGIEANEGDAMTLVVMGDELGAFSSFEFEAQCRWCVAGGRNGASLTGFAISGISETDLDELQKLIRLVTLGGK